jgi:hypothetical protein
VHGLLTDLSRFMFFSFDPVLSEFAFDEEFKASSGFRQNQLQAMIPGEWDIVLQVSCFAHFMQSRTRSSASFCPATFQSSRECP